MDTVARVLWLARRADAAYNSPLRGKVGAVIAVVQFSHLHIPILITILPEVAVQLLPEKVEGALMSNVTRKQAGPAAWQPCA